MRLRALDQVHISAVKTDSLRPGEEFEVSDAAGKDLLKRHPALFESVADAPKPPSGETGQPETRAAADEPDQLERKSADEPDKSEEAPANKMEPAPSNKATGAKSGGKK